MIANWKDLQKNATTNLKDTNAKPNTNTATQTENISHTERIATRMSDNPQENKDTTDKEKQIVKNYNKTLKKAENEINNSYFDKTSNIDKLQEIRNQQVLQDLRSDGFINNETLFLDVFGGSGLIAHNIKQ